MVRVDSFGKMEESTREVGFTESRAAWATIVTIMGLRGKECGWMARDKNGLSDSNYFTLKLLILQK